MHRKLYAFLLFSLAATPIFALTHDQVQELALRRIVFGGIILLAILGAGLFALYIRYQSISDKKPPFLIYFIKHPVVITLFAGAFVILAVNLAGTTEADMTLEQRAQYARERLVPETAMKAYGPLVRENPKNLDYNYEYAAAYYRKDHWQIPGDVSDVIWSMEFPRVYYRKLKQNPDPELRDIGYLGLGMCHHFYGYPNLAMEEFREVQDTSLKYLNFFKGRFYWSFGDFETAENYFWREIDDNGYIAGASEYLVLRYIEAENLEGLEQMLSREDVAAEMPAVGKTYVMIKTMNIPGYFAKVVGDRIDGANLIGLLGALLGALTWLFYLRRVDTFRRERLGSFLAVMAGGAIFSFLAIFLYDFTEYQLGWTLNGKFGNDLLYSIFGIGVIEELVKFLPVLIIWRLTKIIDEPLDFIIYAGASALGFSLVENIMYFDTTSIGLIFGRSLICIIFHIFTASVVVYGIILAKYRYKKPVLPYLLAAFFLSAFFHGFYDFWLLNSSVRALAWISYMVIAASTVALAWMINNGLNQSPHFDMKKGVSMGGLARLLFIGLFAIMLFEYVMFSFRYSVAAGNSSLTLTLLSGGFMMFIVVFSLSNIDVVKGEWKPFQWWNFGTRIDYNRSLGLEIEICAWRKDSKFSTRLPVTGTIIERIRLIRDNRFFLVKLDEPLRIKGYEREYVLVKAKGDGHTIQKGSNMMAALILIRSMEALRAQRKQKIDFPMVDWVIIR